MLETGRFLCSLINSWMMDLLLNLLTMFTFLVEEMSSKIILMMSKNQELSKVSSKDSRIKFQVSRFKNNQDQDSRLKIQESREGSIKISTKFFFKTLSSKRSFHKIIIKEFYSLVIDYQKAEID